MRAAPRHIDTAQQKGPLSPRPSITPSRSLPTTIQFKSATNFINERSRVANGDGYRFL